MVQIVELMFTVLTGLNADLPVSSVYNLHFFLWLCGFPPTCQRHMGWAVNWRLAFRKMAESGGRMVYEENYLENGIALWVGTDWMGQNELPCHKRIWKYYFFMCILSIIKAHIKISGAKFHDFISGQ